MVRNGPPVTSNWGCQLRTCHLMCVPISKDPMSGFTLVVLNDGDDPGGCARASLQPRHQVVHDEPLLPSHVKTKNFTSPPM